MKSILHSARLCTALVNCTQTINGRAPMALSNICNAYAEEAACMGEPAFLGKMTKDGYEYDQQTGAMQAREVKSRASQPH